MVAAANSHQDGSIEYKSDMPTASRRAMLACLLSAGVTATIVAPSRLLAGVSDDLWSGLPDNTAWDSFDMATGDTLLVTASLRGTSVAAILDSGSATSIISASLAARLGLASVEERTIRGMSGRANSKIIHNVTVTIGRQPRLLPVLFIADLDAASAAFGRPIDLVLGQDVLAGRCLALDFAKSRYAFGDRFAGGSDWVFTPFARGANRELLVSASIAGLAPEPLMVDLGSTTALMLSHDYADRNGLLTGKAQSSAMLGGVDGKRLATTFMVNRTDIAGLGIYTIPALAVSNWLSTSAIGNIGLPLLAEFDVVLDFAAGRLWLHTLAARHRPVMLEDHSGLGLAASNNALTVVHVAEGSPAARDNWMIGDRIVAIDGQPVDTSYTQGALWRWRFGDVGRRVKLTIDGGAIREIQLADYY